MPRRSQKTVVSLLFECWTCWMSQAKAKQGILRRYDEVVQLAANWVLSIYHIRRTCMQRQQYFFHIRVWSKVLWLTEETHQNWSSKGIRENGEQTTLWLFKKKVTHGCHAEEFEPYQRRCLITVEICQVNSHVCECFICLLINYF